MRTLSFALALTTAAATLAASPAGAQARARVDSQATSQSRGGYPVGRGRPTLDRTDGRSNDTYDRRRDGRWDDRDDDRRDDDRRGNDRYDNDRRDDDRDGRRGGVVCLDRNHDGYCDPQQGRNDDVCFDRDRNGRCDGATPVGGGGGYSSSLPHMVRVGLLRDGRRTDEATRWLGTDARGAQARYADRDRDGNPERITWYDRSGHVAQVWVDRNDDGRADVVEIYQGGRIVRTVGR